MKAILISIRPEWVEKILNGKKPLKFAKQCQIVSCLVKFIFIARYDTPKKLSEFSHYIPNNDCPKKQCGINCEDCMSYDGEHETCLELWHLHREIKRPPQSWFYVQELEEV